jgi:hypothetical protein
VKRQLAFGVLAIVFACIGVTMAFTFSGDVREARGWPTVPGTILERGVGERLDKNAHVPHVRYRYVVASRTYENDQVFAIRRTGLQADEARKLVDGLPDPVPVHYDPENPARACLVMNSLRMFWMILAFSVAVLCFGAVRIVLAARRMRRS